MEFVDVASRWLHVLSAIALLGGSMFSLWVLMPAAASLPEAEHDTLRAAVLSRWKRFVHGGVGLLLLTGFYNFVRAIPTHRGMSQWHSLLGIKILMAFAVFFLASLLVGRSSAGQAMRKNARLWVGVIVALGIAIVLISGYAKVALPGASPAASAASAE